MIRKVTMNEEDIKAAITQYLGGEGVKSVVLNSRELRDYTDTMSIGSIISAEVEFIK